MTDADLTHLQQWVGTQQVCDDPLAPFVATAMAALLERDMPAGSVLPLPWHWAYAITPPEAGMTGTDGHPARGGFLPPVALPRRMWAGSDIAVRTPLQLLRPVQRISTVAAIDAKRGRTGPLVFVTVDHQWMQDGVECLREVQTIVYREKAPLGSAEPMPEATPPVESHAPSLLATRTPSAVTLFRYSALTYNAHRIHYDLPYAQEEEGYVGLVVHGPLIATMLLNAATPLIGARGIARFTFRAERPAYVDRPILLHSRARDVGLELWSTDIHGQVGVRARLDLAPEPMKATR